MADSGRLHREDPARTGPIRDFSGLYHQPNPDVSSNQPHFGNDERRDREPSDEDGVGLAYRVIEKHINEGKKNAEFFNDQRYNSKAMTDGFQELLERTLRYQNELFPLWLEVLSSAVRIDPARAPFSQDRRPHPQGNGANSNSSKATSIEISSKRPVEISIDLRETSESSPLVTFELRSVDQDKTPLSEIRFESQGQDRIKLRIFIPDNQPSGIYSGVIVSRETAEVRGTLSIHIKE